jgi:hypothetical protein
MSDDVIGVALRVARAVEEAGSISSAVAWQAAST